MICCRVQVAYEESNVQDQQVSNRPEQTRGRQGDRESIRCLDNRDWSDVHPQIGTRERTKIFRTISFEFFMQAYDYNALAMSGFLGIRSRMFARSDILQTLCKLFDLWAECLSFPFFAN